MIFKSSLSVRLRICRLYSLQRSKSPTKKNGILSITAYGSEAGILGSVEYAFIAITPELTLLVPSMNQIALFVNYLY